MVPKYLVHMRKFVFSMKLWFIIGCKSNKIQHHQNSFKILEREVKFDTTKRTDIVIRSPGLVHVEKWRG